VTANPENRLYESSTKNNVALRKVVLGGTKHHRTVQVPPVEVIEFLDGSPAPRAPASLQPGAQASAQCA
jgi:hypothetical protein